MRADDICGDCNHSCHGPAWNGGTRSMTKQPCHGGSRRRPCPCETCVCKDCSKWWKEFDKPIKWNPKKDYAMSEVLEAWDIFKTFVSYERTPKRVKWLRSSYEIEGDIDEWLENKEANVIEEYSKLRKISFDEALRELMDRPTKPWSFK